MDIKLTPFKYNKTIVQEDGITHKIDTAHSYTAYRLSIAETYFEDDRRKVVECIIKDLDRLKDKITEILEQDQERE